MNVSSVVRSARLMAVRQSGGNDRGEHNAIRNLSKIGFQSHKETI